MIDSTDPSGLSSWPRDDSAANPFANPPPHLAPSPPPSTSSPPPRPEPCPPSSDTPSSSPEAPVNRGTTTSPHHRHPARPQAAHCGATQYKPSSMSSGGDTSTLITPMPSVDLEKRSMEQPEREKARDPVAEAKHTSRNSSKRSRRSKQSRESRDPEKAAYAPRNDALRNHTNHLTFPAEEDEHDTDEDTLDDGLRRQEANAVKILLWLCGPCAFFSAIGTGWALIALTITALTQPVRLCARRPTFGQQLGGLLGPTLNLQLRCIYTPLPPHANEDGSYHAFTLAATHLLSPLLAFLMMFAAWTVAIYWGGSAIVGDPAGQDKHDDGKDTVLGLRGWWERWLMRSIVADYGGA